MRTDYAISKLRALLRDLELGIYRPDEFARQMARIAEGATGSVLAVEERCAALHDLLATIGRTTVACTGDERQVVILRPGGDPHDADDWISIDGLVGHECARMRKEVAGNDGA